MDRKDFFKKGIWKAFKGTLETTESTIEVVKSTFEDTLKKEKKTDDASKKSEITLPKITKSKKKLRNLFTPPGANIDIKIYEKKCVGCGDCISACPYNTIFPVFNEKLNKSIAYIDPNNNPCLLCFDFPCIQSCEHEALNPLKKKLPKFGKAKLTKSSCINFENQNYSCNTCKTVCPVENVIEFDKNHFPKFSKNCTGCGICVSACPPFPKAIHVE